MFAPDQALAVLTIAGSMIVSTASLTWWLSSRFRALETSFTNAMQEHDHRDNERFGRIYDRLTVIEVKGGIRVGS